MRLTYNKYLFLLCFIFLGYPISKAQQTLDSVDVLIIDNTNDGNTGGAVGTMMNDPHYREFQQSNPVQYCDGWWTNNSTTYYWGGNSRRASYYGSGNNTGARAQFYCTVPWNGDYVVYHQMFSGNSTTNATVKFYTFGLSAPIDSFRYNMLNNNTPDNPSYGSWYPLGIVNLPAVDTALTVEIGLDSNGTNTLRADAIALVRSHRSGPDIEFGARRFSLVTVSGVDTTINYNFYKHRAPLGFAETTFKWASFSEKVIPVFNLGTETLVITGYESQTNRFSVSTPFPISINPGAKVNIAVRFSPRGEEMTKDTIRLLSNDPMEPSAALPVIGTGVNYNFILNASINGVEPHWNVPSPGGKFFTIGTFIKSTATPWPYPISGGNLNSIVNTGNDPSIGCFYQFRIPDTLSGSYFLEYAGPVYSPNAARNVTVDVKTPFFTNPNPALGDTQRVTDFNSRNVTTDQPWSRIGGNTVFKLFGGDTTTVRYTNPNQNNGQDYLRADLLRVRLVPIAPTISTSLDPARAIGFGSVSIYDSIRQLQLNYSKNVIIGSNGETPLSVNSIRLASGTKFSLANLPSFPVVLPAVDGQYNLTILFAPDSIKTYRDTIFIRSNAPNDTLVKIAISGNGVGTGITVDDIDASTWISPANPLPWTGQPDPANMDKWYRISGQGGVNQNRLIHYIYFNDPAGPETVEWFPNFPFKPGHSVNEVDSFNVYVQLSVGSTISSPAAKYLVYHLERDEPDTFIVNQNSRTVGGDVPSDGIIRLGTHAFKFLRGGQDSHGAGKIFGYVQLVNDTALVNYYYRDSLFNRALRDSFVVRADAIYLEEASNIISSVQNENQLIPDEYSLSQNFPNPFNPTTSIKVAMPKDGRAELNVYDILGAKVATLMNGDLRAGTYTFTWNAAHYSSGVYFYELKTMKYRAVKKMLLIK